MLTENAMPAEVLPSLDTEFQAGWTLHSAPSNLSEAMREVMTVIYFADQTQIMEPDNPYRHQDLANWIPDCKPGDLAASPLNPLVYP